MRRHLSQALVADTEGKVYELPQFGPVGMKAGKFFRLEREDLLKIHPDSELFILPDRFAIVWDSKEKEFVELRTDPFTGEQIRPVAVFLPPGCTSSYNTAYVEENRNRGPVEQLPLFSYAPAVFRENSIYSAYVRTDLSTRHELAGMPVDRVIKKVSEIKTLFPRNRLLAHLENCALEYGCPAAKNFFLGRFEAPLPTSPLCNISCVGCISYQEKISCCQQRIDFLPYPEEVGEIAVYHLEKVPDAIVSYGQGCEGEPLMVSDLLKASIRYIRKQTSSGMVNLNTNATRPDIISELYDAGLDSIRVSINSFQEELYRKYIRTSKYPLALAVDSMRRFHKKGGFVSVNYLSFPGLTDSRHETDKFFDVLNEGIVDMIQWRNMNIDPKFYRHKLGLKVPETEMIGIRQLFNKVKATYPQVMNGYFNPSKKDIEKFKKKKG